MTKHADSMASKIRVYLRDNPKDTPDDVAKALGVNRNNVYATKRQDKLRAQRVRANKKAKAKSAEMSPMLKPAEDWIPKFGDNVGGLVLTDMGEGMARWVRPPESDPVNHPAHYKVGGIETIDFIEAKQLSYNLGNVVKYLTRADHKGNQLQDLQKAQWYLEREIKNIQA